MIHTRHGGYDGRKGNDMKKWKCIFWRGNPQLKNRGYETTRIVEAKTEKSAWNKAEKMTTCIYGTMRLLRVEPEE